MIASGISKLDLKRQNRMQIIRLLRSEGPTSRIDIAKEISITKAAVTIITNEMIQQGILYEKGEEAPKSARVSRGRKKILLDISPTYKLDMGLVLDGGFLHLGVCTLHGEPVEKHMRPIPMEASADEILEMIEKLYNDVLYKNDLKPPQITGLGVCVAPEYFGLFQMKTDPDGSLRSDVFKERLAAFVGVPILFGRLTEGAAIAQADYWQPEEESSGALLLFRCGEALSCSVMLERRIYAGAHGRSGDCSALEGCALSDLSKSVREIFSEEQTPELWLATGGNALKALSVIQSPDTESLDPAVEQALSAFIKTRLHAIEQYVRFYDPGQIVFLTELEEQDTLLDRLEAEARERLAASGYLVGRSRLKRPEFFLAGAALATREFFLNRGGF